MTSSSSKTSSSGYQAWLEHYGSPVGELWKSATEAWIASGFSTSRLKVPSEYNSALGWSPLAQMMLMNTQQLMTAEQKYSIAGNTMDQAKAFMEVDPAKISGFYNFVPVDGTMPIDRLAQANFWKELLMQMARVPQLADAVRHALDAHARDEDAGREEH